MALLKRMSRLLVYEASSPLVDPTPIRLLIQKCHRYFFIYSSRVPPLNHKAAVLLFIGDDGLLVLKSDRSHKKQNPLYRRIRKLAYHF